VLPRNPERGLRYVEIANRDYRELNLGSFILETLGGRFIVPTDTIIYPQSSVKLPSTVTKLSIPFEFIRIADSRGKIVITKPILTVDPVILMPMGLSIEELSKKLIR